MSRDIKTGIGEEMKIRTIAVIAVATGVLYIANQPKKREYSVTLAECIEAAEMSTELQLEEWGKLDECLDLLEEENGEG